MNHDEILDATDALGDAGCKDASIRGHSEGMEPLFERTADSLQAALSSAISDIESAGYRVERLTYFNTVLFPAIAGQRLYKRWRGDGGHDLRRPWPWLNRLLDRLFSLERHVVPTLPLPFGTSLFAVVRRP